MIEQFAPPPPSLNRVEVNQGGSDTGSALMEFPMGTAMQGNLAFGQQYLFAIINKFSMVYLICGGSSVG